jgi:ribosomal protein S12 methylthiotransferase
MLYILKGKQYEITTRPEDADVIVVNTCGFIESAKRESIEAILRMAQYKVHGKARALVAAGCLAQRYHDEIMAEIPEVDAVVGTATFTNIAAVLYEALSGKRVKDIAAAATPDVAPGARIIEPGTLSAYVKIAEGCNHSCAFCAIPALRGPYKSCRLDDIIAETSTLAVHGVKELNVIAQDITRYGEDLNHGYDLADLVRAMDKIDGIEWIRLLYAYPTGLSDRLMSAMAESRHVVPYLDLPLQHASPRILKAMGRPVMNREILGKLAHWRERIPGLVVRTTFIVGFPGETETDFLELRDFIRAGNFEHIGVFTFSAEEGTTAAEMPNQIPNEVASLRRDALMSEAQDISRAHLKHLVGSTVRVLVDSRRPGGIVTGRTYRDAPEVDGKITVRGATDGGPFVMARVTGAADYDLHAEAVQP